MLYLRRMILCTSLGALLGWWLGAQPLAAPSSQSMTSTSQAPRLEQVRELATLLTTRLELSDVQLVELRGVSGGLNGAWIIRGSADLGVDVNQAQLAEVDQATRTATLHLPEPAVTSVSLDHEQSRLISLHYEGLWWLRPQPATASAAWTRAHRDAQVQFRRLASSDAQRERARLRAEAVIGDWCGRLGWRIRVIWRSRTPQS
jgi:hypothetical protein